MLLVNIYVKVLIIQEDVELNSYQKELNSTQFHSKLHKLLLSKSCIDNEISQ